MLYCEPNAPGACAGTQVCIVRHGVGHCAAAFADATVLWNEVENWVRRYVVIRRARLEPVGMQCTLIGCGQPCCNSCQGWARPAGTRFVRVAGVDCLGNECESPQCGSTGGDGFRVLDGDEVELVGRVEEEAGSFMLGDVEINPARGSP